MLFFFFNVHVFLHLLDRTQLEWIEGFASTFPWGRFAEAASRCPEFPGSFGSHNDPAIENQRRKDSLWL